MSEKPPGRSKHPQGRDAKRTGSKTGAKTGSKTGAKTGSKTGSKTGAKRDSESRNRPRKPASGQRSQRARNQHQHDDRPRR
ncbi:MAG TPA: hypothetical protein VK053_15505, partial [Jiangellaceae bacterium]|nr:hypothetical protein [Jiangellaceae bacterium]